MRRFRELRRLKAGIASLALLLSIIAIVHSARRNLVIGINRLTSLIVQAIKPVIVHLLFPRFRKWRLFIWKQTSGRLLETFQ